MITGYAYLRHPRLGRRVPVATRPLELGRLLCRLRLEGRHVTRRAVELELQPPCLRRRLGVLLPEGGERVGALIKLLL